MRNLFYEVTVRTDNQVRAVATISGVQKPSRAAKLNLAQLEVLTNDYLPWLEERQQTHPRDRFVRLGTLLYEALFTDSVKGHFEEALWPEIEAHPNNDSHLTFSLAFEEGVRADVISWPWEFLYCPVGRTFLATDPRVAFSRRYADSVPIHLEPMSAGEQLRVLLVRLQPDDEAQVASALIKNCLEELASKHKNILPPVLLENPNPAGIHENLERIRPHVFHLLAHGCFGDRSSSFALVDSSGHKTRWYGDKSLADLFQNVKPRLIFLQACESGRTSDTISFANGAAWLVRGHLPAVVAMRYPISNRAGGTFAQALYEQIVAGTDLGVAVQRARLALARRDEDSPHDHAGQAFGAPILWMHPEAGCFFRNQPPDSEEVMVQIDIIAPEGRFEASAPPGTLIVQLLQAFLSKWRPSAKAPGQPGRYDFFTGTSEAERLDRTCTIEEVKRRADCSLRLQFEPLKPDSPIGLTIEDQAGRRFSTAVRLSTRVGQLAEAFCAHLRQPYSPNRVLVQLVDRLGGEERSLSPQSSLFEEVVNDNALLRVCPVVHTPKEPRE